jgi:DNA-binding CsgD family transcriptional regulator
MLVGREAEQRRVDSLLESARNERSAVLLLRGEAGIGKTALLEYAREQAADMRVLCCTGIEAEHELAFAGIHQLVRPCTHLLERLPAPQAAALGGALGLRAGGVEDRFLVALGLLSLLAEACEGGPLLCCIDDAQWLDASSAEALLFVARRFEAEPIAMVIAVREGDLRSLAAPGIAELHVGPLPDAAARQLLSGRLEHGASPGVLTSLLTMSNGNPLALLELSAGLTALQLDGAEPILGPPPVRPRVEESFRVRVERLPIETRRLLLLAAADEAGDLGAISLAAVRLGLDPAELDAAERGGLVRLDGTVAFRHPLVRSAIYRSASREERRAAHQALADVASDSARRAWHRAVVTDGADEAIAAELEAAGFDAKRRGAPATACAAFERAVELSSDRGLMGHRLALAARAALDAGRPEAAVALVERARGLVVDHLDQVELDVVRATYEGRRGSPAESQALMQRAARTIARVAPEEATELLVWSVIAALATRRIPEAVAAAVEILPEFDTTGVQGRFTRGFIEGAAAVLAGDAATGGARLTETFEIGEAFTEGRQQGLNAFTAAFLGDYPGCRRVMEEALASSRRLGSVSGNVGGFTVLVMGQLGEGRLAAAQTTIEEGLELSRRVGADNDETGLLALQARMAAQRGRERECREVATIAMQRSVAAGVGWATDQARLAWAELELGLGNPSEALAHFDQLDPVPLPPVLHLAAADVVDAALRVGDSERARSALEAFEAWAPVSNAPLVKALLARCRALLAEDAGEAGRLFEEAIRHDAPVFERARTQLAYGERLRRERRKTEARMQLRNAIDAFEGLGASPWAERARGELQATGETARKRDVSTLDDLTPQELRIARLAAAGDTNREVAAQLFVSPKTVEYHLRKVFAKLAVSSRVELARIPLGEPPTEQDEEPRLLQR